MQTEIITNEIPTFFLFIFLLYFLMIFHQVLHQSGFEFGFVFAVTTLKPLYFIIWSMFRQQMPF
jgi:hypothetical protein